MIKQNLFNLEYLKEVLPLTDLSILAISWLTYIVIKNILVEKILYRIIRKTPFQWDTLLLESRALEILCLFIPLLTLNHLFTEFKRLSVFISIVTQIAILICSLIILIRLVKAFQTAYNRTSLARNFPFHSSYLTLIRLIIFMLGLIFSITIILGKSPLTIITGLGAFSAILILVFKDTILSFISSIIINSQDLVREGDWIEAPEFGADGDVIEVGLHIIKVQNWDKTIATIPTYKIMDTSFKNWRGMKEANGRRIMRSIYIDLHSIKKMNETIYKQLQSLRILEDYFKNKLLEKPLEQLSNIGTFRKYVELYLKSHPNVNHNQTLMVRQLQAVQNGLPIEIYCFTNTVVWVEYENIQSDIFDHLYTVLDQFDLSAYQLPTSIKIS